MHKKGKEKKELEKKPQIKHTKTQSIKTQRAAKVPINQAKQLKYVMDIRHKSPHGRKPRKVQMKARHEDA